MHPIRSLPSHRAWFLVLAALLVAGCPSGTYTTADAYSQNGKVFPMTSEEANKVLATAMATQFPGVPIVPVEFPLKGYTATVYFGLDHHAFLASMVPANGRSSTGEVVKGYAFQVSHNGTFISGSSRAKDLFNLILGDASQVTRPLPLVP